MTKCKSKFDFIGDLLPHNQPSTCLLKLLLKMNIIKTIGQYYFTQPSISTGSPQSQIVINYEI